MKSKIYFFCVFIGLCATLDIPTANGQEKVQGDLRSFLQEIIDRLPGSGGNDYFNPNPFEAVEWAELIEKIINEKFEEAAEMASSLSYNLLAYTDTVDPDQPLYYVLMKTDSGIRYWGTYVFNATACRDMVIQSPHPVHDANTGDEAIHVFLATRAFALFITGTHRCNSQTISGCSGTTGVCGSSAPYTISDVAHNISSPFHLATKTLYDLMKELYFIQLHGFGKKDTDPYAIMSNGSRNATNPDKVLQISQALEELDPSLSFVIGHIDTNWNRLLAFTNVQGRYINGSEDPCTENATEGNGHFIHIEQEWTKFRAGKDQWDKMADALAKAFDCTTVAIEKAPIEQTKYSYSLLNNELIFHFPDSNKYQYNIFNSIGRLLISGEAVDGDRITIPASGVIVINLWTENRLVDSTMLFNGY